jgi:hypothetical protein
MAGAIAERPTGRCSLLGTSAACAAIWAMPAVVGVEFGPYRFSPFIQEKP